MTEEKPSVSEAVPTTTLSPEAVEIERLCAELHASARRGEIYNIIINLETAHPADTRFRRIGFMFNTNITKEFVKHAEHEIMELAERRLEAHAPSGEKRPH